MWKKKMPHLLCLLSWRQMGLPVFKSIFWLTALFCTEKDHEWHWKRVCTHARSSCQSLQTRGGEDVPTGHQFCYFHLGKSEKSKTRCILEYGISDTEKSVNMFSSLPQKPAEVCKILGLCSSCDKEQMLSYFAQEALQAAVTSDNVSIWSLERHIAGRKKKQKHCAELLPFMCLNQVKPSTECSFCTFLIKTLEGLLPKERTEVKHGYTAHKNSTSLCCTQTLKSNQTTQLRVITARVFFFFFFKLCSSSTGSSGQAAGRDLPYSAGLLPQPVWDCDRQGQQDSAGCNTGLCDPAGHLSPHALL